MWNLALKCLLQKIIFDLSVRRDIDVPKSMITILTLDQEATVSKFLEFKYFVSTSLIRESSGISMYQKSHLKPLRIQRLNYNHYSKALSNCSLKSEHIVITVLLKKFRSFLTSLFSIGKKSFLIRTTQASRLYWNSDRSDHFRNWFCKKSFL